MFKSTSTEQYEEHIDDFWFIEPSIYKEIEWLEFPYVGNQNLEALEAALHGVAKFPIIKTATGLRVLGYARA